MLILTNVLGEKERERVREIERERMGERMREIERDI